MYTTYGDVQRGDIIDGHIVKTVTTYQGGDCSFTTIETEDRGKRTECSDHVTYVQHHADPTLVDVDQVDLDQFVRAVNCSIGVVPTHWMIQALHGVALEENRRRAMHKIRNAHAYL